MADSRAVQLSFMDLPGAGGNTHTDSPKPDFFRQLSVHLLLVRHLIGEPVLQSIWRLLAKIGEDQWRPIL
jgi:hypothetical protein